MVFVATRSGSTSSRSSAQRSTARTILLTSTGSPAPLRLMTCICVRRWVGAGGAVVAVASVSAGRVAAGVSAIVMSGLLAPCSTKVTRRAGGQAPTTTGECVAGRPTQPRTTPHAVARDIGWQVFGLVGRTDPVAYWPSLPKPGVGSVLHDGGRSQLPLRGSPGIAPGSLLSRRRTAARRRTNRRDHYMWVPRRRRTPYLVSACLEPCRDATARHHV